MPTCLICLEKQANYLVTPCGHQCGCLECLQVVQQRSGSCPVCRGKICTLQRVFVEGGGDTKKTAAAIPTPSREEHEPVQIIYEAADFGQLAPKAPACGCDLCWKISCGIFTVAFLCGFGLLARIMSTVPKIKQCSVQFATSGSQGFISFNCLTDVDCTVECRHDDAPHVNMVVEACCEGIEDCGPRAWQWIGGWALLLSGVLFLAISASCLCCCRIDMPHSAVAWYGEEAGSSDEGEEGAAAAAETPLQIEDGQRQSAEI